MSATYARITPSLPCGNPNASQTDERPVQLIRTDGHVTWMDEHVDNPAWRVSMILPHLQLEAGDRRIRLSGSLRVLSPEASGEESDPSRPTCLAEPRKIHWQGFASG